MQPCHRGFRYSLRTLLIVTLLIGLLLGWIVKERIKSAHEAAITFKLHEAGWASRTVSPFDTVDSNQQVENLAWWHRFAGQVLGERVDLLTRRGGTVEDLSPLAELQNLRFLYVLEADFRRDDLSPLAKLTNLQVISFKRSNVSDISPLAGLKNLKSLKLRSTQVKDLTPLANLKNLQELNLAKTPVNDLSPLVGLTDLEQLNISGTQVAEGQIQVLQRALPNCKIAHDSSR